MNSARIGLMIFGAIASATATAQTTTAPAPASAPPAVSSPANPAPADQQIVVDAAMLESGANSFTEGQAQSRLEAAGFTNLQGLTKDEAGFWRGRGMRNGATTDLAMDFRGRIAAGPAVTVLPNAAASVTPPAGTTTTTR